jgi:hypothetical protein
MIAVLHRSFLLELNLSVLLAIFVSASSVFAASYSELRAAAVKNCHAIDPDEYQSGLIFNPDGYRSFYVQSECFQKTAVQFRDTTLCVQVKRRHSLFSSSWGYSRAHCRELVAEGVAADRKKLEEIKKQYLQGAVRLRDFRIERNGNGRDFDIIPSFTGVYGHGHTLRFEVVGPRSGQEAMLLHSSGYYVDGNSNLRIFVRQEEVRKRFPDFTLNRPYTVRATIVLDIGNGGQSGRWSDAFIEQVFPAGERSQSLVKEVRF